MAPDYFITAAKTRSLIFSEPLIFSGRRFPASPCETAGARKVWNCTRSFEKSRSSVQSSATRTFFSNRGSFYR